MQPDGGLAADEGGCFVPEDLAGGLIKANQVDVRFPGIHRESAGVTGGHGGVPALQEEDLPVRDRNRGIQDQAFLVEPLQDAGVLFEGEEIVGHHHVGLGAALGIEPVFLSPETLVGRIVFGGGAEELVTTAGDVSPVVVKVGTGPRFDLVNGALTMVAGQFPALAAHRQPEPVVVGAHVARVAD